MSGFKNKKILFVCKESFSFPLYYLMERWKGENSIAAFFFNPLEAKYSECSFNKHTYYRWKDIKGIKIYDSIKIADIFVKQGRDYAESREFLQDIEKKYTHYLGINEQIISSQYLTRHYHYRSYRGKCSYIQQLNWVVLNYKNVLRILKEFSPDMIIDLDTAELARIVLLEVAYSKRIPYITLDFPRYEIYKTTSYTLGKKVDPFFYDCYKDAFSLDDSKLEKEHKYINQFRREREITTNEHEIINRGAYCADNFIKVAKRLFTKIVYLMDQDRAGRNKKIKKTSRILYNNSCGMFNYFLGIEYRKQILSRKNPYFQIPDSRDKYVYMPLHMIPESTTFTLAPMYINELTIIEAISKSLPSGWWLYVKEHPAMLGERPIKFYKEVNDIPNAKMVQYNYYKDPKPWIVNAQGVVTISGTTAFEAALLGKPSIVFADVPFKLIDGVFRVRSYEDLPYLLKKFDNWTLDNRHSCAAYLYAVKRVGVEFNLNYMLERGERIVNGKDKIDEDFINQIDNLEKLYIAAYMRYMKYESRL